MIKSGRWDRIFGEISTFVSSWGSNDEARRIHSSTADPQSENEKTIETLYEINQVMNLGDRGHLHWLSGRDAKSISGDQLRSSEQKFTSLWSTFKRQIIWIKRQKLVSFSSGKYPRWCQAKGISTHSIEWNGNHRKRIAWRRWGNDLNSNADESNAKQWEFQAEWEK